MLHIRNIAQLKECLFSDKQTGIFITPIQDFIKDGHISKLENRTEYCLDLGHNETLQFQVSENIITFKGYYTRPEKNIVHHRENNLPAAMSYFKNGEINTYRWFVNGISVRQHYLEPIETSRSTTGIWSFKYAKSDDGFLEISYIIYDKGGQGKGRLIDMMLRQRGINISFKQAKKIYPFIENIGFDDCHDLSKRIFTDDEITVLRMIDI